MKKNMIMILFLSILIVPFNVNAEKLYTTVLGNDIVQPGANIKYVVILDKLLTNYEAEISYDREYLNLVNIDETKIDTETKAFSIEKSNPIKINVTSENPTMVVYTITFNIKKSAKFDKTSIDIKTLGASNNNINFVSDDINYDILFNKIDTVNEIVTDSEDNTIKDTVNDLKKIFDDYRDIITYTSLLLNIILVVSLIRSIVRKKVDYDF